MLIARTILILLIMGISAHGASITTATDKPGLTNVEMILNEGHGSETAQIEICLDGRLAVSRAEDSENSQIKLWDLHTGRLLRNFNGYDFALSPDRTYLYINQSSINPINNAAISAPTMVWDLANMTALTEQLPFRITRISADGKLALSSDYSDDQPLRNAFIFDLATHKKLSPLPGQLLAISNDLSTAILAQDQQQSLYSLHTGRSRRLTGDDYWLSPDGKTLFSLERSGTARLWSNKRAGVINLSGDYKDCLLINNEVVLLVARSGELILYQIANNRYLTFPKERLDQYAVKAAFSADNRSIWIFWSTLQLTSLRISNGRQETLLTLPQAVATDVIYSDVAIDPTHLLISAGGLEYFHCWRVVNGVVKHSGSRLARQWSPGSCRINNSGELMVCQQFYDEETAQLIVWDLTQSKMLSNSQLAELSDNTPILDNIQLAGSWALVKGYRDYQLYNLRRDQRVMQLNGSMARLSSDGNRLINIVNNHQIDIYDLTSLTRISTIKTNEKTINFALNREGNRIAVLDNSGTITNYQTDTAAIISVISADRMARIKLLHLSNSGNRLITAHSDNSLKIWPITGGEAIAQLSSGDHNISAIYLSDDEQRALTIDKRDGNCRLWDLAGSRLLRTISAVSSERISDVVISNSLNYAAINGVIWDLNHGVAMSELGRGYATISADGVNAIVADRRGYQLWQLAEQELLATISSYEREWLIYTPDNQFDSSKQARELINWYSLTQSLSIEENRDYQQQFYRPGLLTKLWQRGRQVR